MIATLTFECGYDRYEMNSKFSPLSSSFWLSKIEVINLPATGRCDCLYIVMPRYGKSLKVEKK